MTLKYRDPSKTELDDLISGCKFSAINKVSELLAHCQFSPDELCRAAGISLDRGQLKSLRVLAPHLPRAAHFDGVALLVRACYRSVLAAEMLIEHDAMLDSKTATEALRGMTARRRRGGPPEMISPGERRVLETLAQCGADFLAESEAGPGQSALETAIATGDPDWLKQLILIFKISAHAKVGDRPVGHLVLRLAHDEGARRMVEAVHGLGFLAADAFNFATDIPAASSPELVAYARILCHASALNAQILPTHSRGNRL